MALFDFLKGLNASERRELDETKQLVSSLQNEIESLRGAIPSLDGYAKSSEIPSLHGVAMSIDIPDVSRFITKSDLPDLTGYVLLKDIPKMPDLSEYMKAKDFPGSANYWKNQNDMHPVDKATLFIDTTTPTKAPDHQITIVTE